MTTMKGDHVTFMGPAAVSGGKGPGMSMRGVRFCPDNLSLPPSPSLIRLNNAALVFEIETLSEGTVHDTGWEGK